MSSLARRLMFIALSLLLGARLPAATIASASPQSSIPDYADGSAWAVRPGKPGGADAVPAGASPRGKRLEADIFYVHPTSFRSDAFNADMAEESWPDGPNRALMARQAGAFNACCRIFAPWYRQASFRAFTDRAKGGEQAYDLAYQDVLRAFDHYLAHDNHGRPFLLVGHSQGALHVLRLLSERIDGTPLQDRLIAAYVIGIGMSDGDFGTTFRSLRPCRTPDQTSCVLGWETFLEGSDTTAYVDRNEAKFAAAHPAGDRRLLCVNPLTFDAAEPSAGASADKGTLPQDPTDVTPTLVPGAIAARCSGGVVLVTPPPAALGLSPLPGGSMHYHDIALFYANIRDNALLRVAAFEKARR